MSLSKDKLRRLEIIWEGLSLEDRHRSFRLSGLDHLLSKYGESLLSPELKVVLLRGLGIYL